MYVCAYHYIYGAYNNTNMSMTNMKVIIAGSRNFNDYDKLFQVCTRTLLNKNEIKIVSGTANGADKLGEKFAIVDVFISPTLCSVYILIYNFSVLVLNK